MKIITKNEKETFNLGMEVAKKLKGGELVLLSGDLGAGKTVFTKGLAKQLKLNPRKVNSPTFIVLKEYELENKNIHKFIHIDAYRISSIDELNSIGFNEYILRNDAIVIIEWAEKIKELKKIKKTIRVKIKYLSEDSREVSLNY